MDTSWLKDFIAVVDEGGFSRAAARRAISQPAFSRRIRSLEQWVGTALFDRSTHHVALTAAGELFLPVAQEILRRIQNGREEALNANKAAQTTLRFASTHALSLTFFPQWLRKLGSDVMPGTQFQLTADNMVSCERMMLEGRVQFLLCHHHPAAATRLSNSFRSLPVGEDLLVPVAAPAMASCALNDLPHLTYTSESGIGRILRAAWASSGREYPADSAFASHLASVLLAMAKDGRGVAWSPLSLVRDDLADGRVVRLGSAADEVSIEIRMYRPSARQSFAAEQLWSYLSGRKA